MILFYADESGTGLGDKRTPYFILASIAIATKDWEHLDNQVAAIKRQWVSYAKPEDFEIKGRYIRQGLEFFRNMNWEQRSAILQQIAQTLADLPCYIIAVQVDKRHLPRYVASEDDLYRLALW